jgi:hypothetical protein
MSIRSLSTAALLLATTGSSLSAQLSPGARIRVRYDTTATITVVGTLDSIWDNSLSVRVNASKVVAVPLDAISTLELSTGRHRTGGKGAKIGAAFGVLTGLVVGIMAASNEPKCGTGFLSDFCEDMKPAQTFAYAGIGAVAGSLAGAGVGWLVGEQFHADSWMPVPVPRLQIAPVSYSNGIGIGVSFRF